MADNSAIQGQAVKMTRILAIIHIIVGFVLICFGIADRVVQPAEFSRRNSIVIATGDVYYGIWIGAWMCITGGLGIPASGRERTGSRDAFAGVFMGFSITSAMLGGGVIICYSISTYLCTYKFRGIENFDASMAIRTIILLLGIVEFAIGICAATCCCFLTRCACCATPQQGQRVAYTANPAGYVMTQGLDGVPMAVSIQGGAGMVAFQASETQANQPPMVLMPMGNQHMTAQAAPAGRMPATGYTSQ